MNEQIKTAACLLYNQGLYRAKMHDISGSIQLLQHCLKLDKSNIDARNLLGLCFFEIGETVLALQQWVISKNMRANNNLAEKYLKTIQENQTHLDKLNTAIKKYNQALGYIQQGNDDLAVIQLKKVLSLNTNFIKAYILLSLCYMKADQLQRAQKMLHKVLLLDKNNYIALKYMEEIQTMMPNQEKQQPKEEEMSPETGVVPHQVPKFVSSSFHQLIFIAGGALVGLAVAMFLISPSQLKKRDVELSQLKEQVTVQTAQIETLSSDLEEEISLRTALEEDKTKLSDALEVSEGTSSEVAKMLAAIQANNAGDYATAASALSQVDATVLEGTELQTVYTSLTTALYPRVADDAYNSGYNFYVKKNKDDYAKAIEQFDLALKFGQNATYLDRLFYYRGVSYFQIEKFDLAKKDLEYLIATYPDSGRIADAQWYLSKITQ